MADNAKQYQVKVKWRRDTSANWTAKDPILLDGEIIIVDTASGETRFKIGDGSKTFSQLPFQDGKGPDFKHTFLEGALHW